MNIDIITIWPRSQDYPPFRRILKNIEPFYNKAICVLNGTSQDTYGEFLRENTNSKKVLFINSRQATGDEDWRNVAVHAALGASSSDWIWFLEQDFFFTKGFVEKLLRLTSRYDALGFWEANRLHPACLLIKRSVLDKTKKDFSVVPGKLDHFGQFSQDVVAELGKDRIGEIDKLGLQMEIDWYHMQGLTHNYNLVRANDTDKIYKKAEFLTYNEYSILMGVPISDDYIKETNYTANLLGEYEEDLTIFGFLKGIHEYLC